MDMYIHTYIPKNACIQETIVKLKINCPGHQQANIKCGSRLSVRVYRTVS